MTYFLKYDEWFDKYHDVIYLELAENGADREMDFNPEEEFRIRYKAPGLCQVDGAKEYKDGYCVQHYHLSLLLREWEQSPLSLFYSRTISKR